MSRMHAIALGLVCLANLISFAAFCLDKRRAVRQQRRISEQRLLLLVAAMGAVGGWLAMQICRHKTRKITFNLLMILMTGLNFFWVWLYVRYLV